MAAGKNKNTTTGKNRNTNPGKSKSRAAGDKTAAVSVEKIYGPLNESLRADVCVTGSGPAGLMAAIYAARNKAAVIVLERKEEPCKKLYATGNGRCNFTNLSMEGDVYRGGGSSQAFEITDTFDRNDLIYFFHDLGLMTRHIGDYVYPYNEQASSVAGVLLAECRRLGVKIFTDTLVVDITKDEKNGLFQVMTEGGKGSVTAAAVIVTPGGKASPAHGSDGNLNKVIRKLGHDIINQEPALVPLVFEDKSLSELAGTRIKCSVSLYGSNDGECDLCKPASGGSDTKSPYRQQSDRSGVQNVSRQGEIIINRDCISGIPVLQISRYAVQEIVSGRKPYIVIDFFPEIDENELKQDLIRTFRTWDDRARTAEEALGFCLNQNVAAYILRRLYEKMESRKKSPGLMASEVTDEDIDGLVRILKAFPVLICDHAGFSRAQTTAGGVDFSQVDEKSMGSRLVEGLYFAGELLDTDGDCGGYNLHFAFASGRIAGESAAKRCLEDA